MHSVMPGTGGTGNRANDSEAEGIAPLTQINSNWASEQRRNLQGDLRISTVQAPIADAPVLVLSKQDGRATPSTALSPPDSPGRGGKERATNVQRASIMSAFQATPLWKSKTKARNFLNSDGGQDLWARIFHIRCVVSQREQNRLLRHRLSEEEEEGGVAVPGAPSYTKPEVDDSSFERIGGVFRRTEANRMLQVAALLGIWFAPLQFSTEPVCITEGEKRVALAIKAMSFPSSLLYIVLAFGMHLGNWGVRGERSNFRRREFGVDVLILLATFAESWHLGEVPILTPTWSQYLILLSLLKVQTFMKSSSRISGFAIQVFELFVLLATAGHLAACISLKMAFVERDTGGSTWMDGGY
ncbi:unnamed protein product, partial [Polarella glacialis]